MCTCTFAWKGCPRNDLYWLRGTLNPTHLLTPSRSLGNVENYPLLLDILCQLVDTR